MKALVFDLESTGLYIPEIKKIWCICAIDVETGEEYTYGPEQIVEGYNMLQSADILIGHFIINYDLPLLRHLQSVYCPFNFKGTVLDTVILSRLLYPDRDFPVGMKPNKSGPHSIEAWGYRLGHKKVEDQDWSRYTEDMMRRCLVDTQINLKVYKALYRECMQ